MPLLRALSSSSLLASADTRVAACFVVAQHRQQEDVQEDVEKSGVSVCMTLLHRTNTHWLQVRRQRPALNSELLSAQLLLTQLSHMHSTVCNLQHYNTLTSNSTNQLYTQPIFESTPSTHHPPVLPVSCQ